MDVKKRYALKMMLMLGLVVIMLDFE